MSTDAPVSQWIRAAESGDADAQAALWNHYFARVVRLARARMFVMQGTIYDEEDAAISAMHSVFRGMQNGRFPDLHDRHNLWRLLVLIAKRKVRAQWRKETAARRGGAADAVANVDLTQIISSEPTPDFVSEMMDETERLIGMLEDARLKRIALLRLDGFTYDEIADQLGVATRTVSRKMDLIRDIWGVSEDD